LALAKPLLFFAKNIFSLIDFYYVNVYNYNKCFRTNVIIRKGNGNMPPKAKFSKEQITQAALDIIREKGTDSLTARALGDKLGSSACPIFTVFKNMEEVQQSAVEEAKALYKEYVNRGLTEIPAFKGVGTQYINFAINEPNLFQLLFMTKQSSISDIDGVLPVIEESYDEILASITNSYGVESNVAARLYRHLWIYTHGIATLCVTKMCRFTGEEISAMMTEIFISLLKNIKGE
jgi:AcrR family transcriptional regulator